MWMFFMCSILAITLMGCADGDAKPPCLQDELPRQALLTVPYINQTQAFPTGCEAVSAVMLLRFYGYELSVADFVDQYLPCAPLYTNARGQLCGPDPAYYYVGDPRTNGGYGCYASVIEKALCAYFGATNGVQSTGGQSLAALCESYVCKGTPVLVWAGINMQPLRNGTTWLLPHGQTFTWLAGEHCLVLVGYDAENYIFNDPLKGEKVSYKRADAEACYATLGRQSLVILPPLCENSR